MRILWLIFFAWARVSSVYSAEIKGSFSAWVAFVYFVLSNYLVKSEGYMASGKPFKNGLIIVIVSYKKPYRLSVT